MYQPRVRRAGAVIATLATVTTMALALAAPAQATRPGTNGRIVFHREDADGFAQVWTANPDLTAQRELTSGRVNSGWATWSPDATRIAFDSDRADPDPNDDFVVNDVFTMARDGTDVRKVTDSVGFSGDPAFSSDGSLLAFDANRGVRSGSPSWPSADADLSVFVVGVDGTGLRRLTVPPAGSSDTEPRFSPDGTHVVFTRFQGGHFLANGRVAGDTSALFTVRLDGTDLQRVTGWGHKAGQADWSPDGRSLAFEAVCCRLGTGGVFTVRADGSGFTTVVNGHGVTGIGNDTALQVDGYYDPVWSPDGTKLLAGRELRNPDGSFRSGLVVVDVERGDLHWVSADVNGEHQPDWGTAPLE